MSGERDNDMGNFYTNFTARSSDHNAVVEILTKAGRTAYVAPAINGNTVFYDRDSDEQDFKAIRDVGIRVSLELEAPVLAILNHDDDILCFWLFETGEITDGYNSRPSYFDESSEDEGPTACDTQKICRAFACPQDRATLFL